MYAEHHTHEIATDISPHYCHSCEISFYAPHEDIVTAVEKIKTRMKNGTNQAPETREALKQYADARQDIRNQAKQQGMATNPDFDPTESVF